MQPCSTTIYGVCSVKRRSRAKSWESFQTPLQLGQTILLLTTKLFSHCTWHMVYEYELGDNRWNSNTNSETFYDAFSLIPPSQDSGVAQQIAEVKRYLITFSNQQVKR